MHVPVAGSMEGPHQTTPSQVAIVLPFPTDAGAARGEGCSRRERSAHLPAMADVRRRSRHRARCCRVHAVELVVAPPCYAATDGLGNFAAPINFHVANLRLGGVCGIAIQINQVTAVIVGARWWTQDLHAVNVWRLRILQEVASGINAPIAVIVNSPGGIPMRKWLASWGIIRPDSIIGR